MYSLGAVLCEVLKGRRPFTGLSLFEICAKVIRDFPEMPRSVNPQLSAGWTDPEGRLWPQVLYRSLSGGK